MTGLISLLSQGLSRVFSNTTVQTSQILQHLAFFRGQLLHPYMTTGKTIALMIRSFVGKVMSLLVNTLSRFVIAFLPRSKYLLISWLQSPSREGNGNPLQYSCLENPMDRGAWWAAVYGVAQSQTRLKQLRSSSSSSSKNLCITQRTLLSALW